MSAAPMPKTVKVGAHVYTVLRKSASIMEDSIGACDSSSLQITVRQRLRKSKSQETLLHEILHAITLQAHDMAKPRDDEDFILATAPVLLQVIQENPDLLVYLTQ